MNNITPITTTLGEFLAIKVPEGAQSLLDIELVTNQAVIPYGQSLQVPDGHYKSFPNHTFIDLPPGTWEIIGFRDSLTEEQWRGIVEESDRHPGIGLYVDYTAESTRWAYLLKSATESGHSLLNANGIFKSNPYGLSKPVTCYFHKGQAEMAEKIFKAYQDKWQSAQEKVFNPLILRKL